MERKTVADAAPMEEQENSLSVMEEENKVREEQAGLDLLQELSALPFHEVESLDGDEFSLCDLRDFCFLLNDQGEILSANDSALRWLNLSVAEMKGLALFQAVPGEFGELLGVKAEEAWAGRTPLEFSVNMGQRYYRGSLCRLSQDGHTRMALFLNDMTAARKLARNLSDRESFYRELVQNQSELICTVSPAGELRFVNAAFLQYYDLGLDSAPGMSFFSLVANEDLQAVQRHLKSLETQRPMATLEFRSQGGGGKVRWQQWNFRCLFDENGKPDQFLCVGRDISTRKIVEEALLQVTSEKEAIRLNLEAIFRSIQDGIVTVDTEMHVIEYNKAIARMCPLMEKLSPGRKMLANDFPMCGELCCEVVNKTLRTRKPVKEQRIECRAGQGGKVMVLNCSPLKDTMDKFSGAVLVMRDISRLAQLEQKLVERNRFQNIVGKSEKMQNVYDLLEQLAEVDTTVLVNGESGTGKELIVDALHYMGPRANGPLVKVNCSALSENLLESELFGHVRGSFTGAVQDKVGRFQAAEKGTIFLDEIGDISPRIQLKLLRGLERKEFERVGDNKTYYADVRVVAATNVDLMQKVKEGVFREDLYYRLKVVTLPLPPLRERKEDIPLLVDHFLVMYRTEFKKHIVGVSDDVLSLFLRYGWPGNVRELKHAMEHACILCHGEQIELGDLPAELGLGGQQSVAHGKSTSSPRSTTRQDILDALTKAGGNKAKAARILGVSRRTLYRKLDQLGIAYL